MAGVRTAPTMARSNAGSDTTELKNRAPSGGGGGGASTTGGGGSTGFDGGGSSGFDGASGGTGSATD
jgi:hypothetical protein